MGDAELRSEEPGFPEDSMKSVNSPHSSLVIRQEPAASVLHCKKKRERRLTIIYLLSLLCFGLGVYLTTRFALAAV